MQADEAGPPSSEVVASPAAGPPSSEVVASPAAGPPSSVVVTSPAAGPPSSVAVASPAAGLLESDTLPAGQSEAHADSVRFGPSATLSAASHIAVGDYVVILAGGEAYGPLSVGKYGVVVTDDKSSYMPLKVRGMCHSHWSPHLYQFLT